MQNVCTNKIVMVGSRRSELALVQTNFTIQLLEERNPDIKFEVVKISTVGDKILDTALSKIGDKNLFTKELETSLIENEVDFVVHSLKDVTTIMPDGLVLGCVYNRNFTEDVVLMAPTKRGLKLRNLTSGSIIGTSAMRRIATLSRLYPNLKFVSIRGNVNSRIRKLDNVEQDNSQIYDAIILAKAGIVRLDLSDRIDEILDESFYAVSQGALTCECRENDKFILNLLSHIHEESAALTTIAERSLMRHLDGGCSTPIGVRCIVSPEMGIRPYTLKLCANVLSIDGKKCVQASLKTKLPYRLPNSRNLYKSPCKVEKIQDKLPSESSQAEITAALNPSSLFLGLTVTPSCTVARLRMARARRLGLELAIQLLSAGADDILNEIRSHAP